MSIPGNPSRSFWNAHLLRLLPGAQRGPHWTLHARPCVTQPRSVTSFPSRLFSLSLPVFPQRQPPYTCLRTLTLVQIPLPLLVLICPPRTPLSPQSISSLHFKILFNKTCFGSLPPPGLPAKRTDLPSSVSVSVNNTLQIALVTLYLNVCVYCLCDRCVGHCAHGVSLSPELSICVWQTLQGGSGKGSEEEQKNGRGKMKCQVKGTEHLLVVKSTGFKSCPGRLLALRPEDLEARYLTFWYFIKWTNGLFLMGSWSWGDRRYMKKLFRGRCSTVCGLRPVGLPLCWASGGHAEVSKNLSAHPCET